MATNIIYDRIFKGLRTLFTAANIPVAVDDAPRSPTYIRLSLVDRPEQVANNGASRTMQYTVALEYYTGKATPRQREQRLADIMDVLHDNTAYTSGSTYYWHGGAVIGSPDLPVEDEKWAARLVWTTMHTECV